MSTQPQQQQQSLSEEGSKEKHHPQWTKTPKRRKCSGSSFRPSRQCATRTSPLQHPHHKLKYHHELPQSAIATKITRIHQNAMEPPTDPPEHLQMAKAQELLKQGIRHQNLTLELHQVQVLLHSLPIHPRTLSCVQHVAKVATGAEIVLIIISVTFVG